VKINILRRITLAVAFLAVVVGLVLNAGTGTFSSFGWQAIAAICPLGVLESFVASRTIFPRALIVLVVTAVFVIIFGKAFCSWLCPVVPLRSLLRVKTWKALLKHKNGKEVNAQIRVNPTDISADIPTDVKTPPTCKHCSGCASQRTKLDSRHLILGGTLLSAAVFGFPVFCLICPIGLTFGTVILLWQLFGPNEVGLALLLYPALLVLELLVLRKWCVKFCPLGALLSLLSLPNRLFRPKVDSSQCLRMKGVDCSVCIDACPEEIDPHCQQDLHDCSKCGLCAEKCPASAISIPFRQKNSSKSVLP
jgi:ferredoxin-type protein NapH